MVWSIGRNELLHQAHQDRYRRTGPLGKLNALEDQRPAANVFASKKSCILNIHGTASITRIQREFTIEGKGNWGIILKSIQTPYDSTTESLPYNNAHTQSPTLISSSE